MKSGKNTFFEFKEFVVRQDKCGMKVCTDSCIFGAMVEVENAREVLDIGSGTGLLSLMIAQRSQATIQAVEIDNDAVMQALENFLDSKWVDQLQLAHTSFQNYAGKESKGFDVIVSNPPFFTKNLVSENAKRNRALHNTELPFEDLAKGVAKLLREPGKFWVMLPKYESEVLEELLEEKGLRAQKKVFIHHSCKTKVLRVIAVYAFSSSEVVEENFYIKTPEENYTKEFENLLQPYYLIF